MNKYKSAALSALFFYMVMLAVNAAANTAPLNGLTTGDISSMFPNKFVPAPLTFSIWGLIYLMLGIYTFNVFYRAFALKRPIDLETVRLYTATCLLNSAWIFSWHFLQIGLSLLVMAALYVLLFMIRHGLRNGTGRLTPGRVEIAAFAIYFAWINAAFLANFTVFFIYGGVKAAGSHGWAYAMIGLAALAAVFFVSQKKDLWAAPVGVWVFAGIIMKQGSAPDGRGLSMAAAAASLAVVIAFLIAVNRLRRAD